MFTKLRNFCIENNYFTCGSNDQYSKLFEMAEAGSSVHDLAVVIYVCSDHDTLEVIESKLHAIM